MKKKINYRHYIAIVLTVLLLCSGHFFQNSILRTIETVKDLGLSVAFYFCELYRSMSYTPNPITPTVNNLSAVLTVDSVLPDDWNGFVAKFQNFGNALINENNFNDFLYSTNETMRFAMPILVLSIQVLILLFMVADMMLLSENKKKRNQDSLPLKLHRKCERYFYIPVYSWLKEFTQFCKKGYAKIWLFVWLIYANIASIVIAFVAYFFYFFAIFDLASLYTQFQKLFIDIAQMFSTLPGVVWVVIALVVLDKLRKRIGLKKLQHQEKKNKGFAKSLGLVIVFVGSMGVSKTLTLTDITLSLETIFRTQAFEIIQQCDIKFSAFAWCNLENEIVAAILNDAVNDLPGVEKWVKERRIAFESSSTAENIFDYDFKLYGLYYDGELKQEYIFDVIETYSKAFFVYIVKTSLIYGNYSIRSDNILETKGHFPKWDLDFFDRKSKNQAKNSKYSHILNFDWLRLSKKLSENPINHNFGFGIVSITEIAKERGNKVENEGLKKTAKETNKKNDGFNLSWKMARHKATIANIPFIRFYCDDQRAAALNSDALQLTTLINIAEKSESKLAMPFFFIEELLHDFIFKKFIDLYYEYRHLRSDNSLFMYLFKRLVSAFHRYYENINNMYGFFVSTLETEAGTQDGKIKSHKYYLAKKKIFSDRYCTDCYSSILAEKAINGQHIDKVQTYASTKATESELNSQDSYFVKDFLQIGNVEESPPIAVYADVKKAFSDAVKKIDTEKLVAEIVKSLAKDELKTIIEDMRNGDE